VLSIRARAQKKRERERDSALFGETGRHSLEKMREGTAATATAGTSAATTNAPTAAINQKYQGIDIHSFGMRILKKQGWQEGTGLGPNKSGLKKHLHASRREHNAGLGTDRRDNTGVVGADWTRNAKNFESVLKGLQDYKKEDDADEDDEGDKDNKKKDKKKEKKEKKKRKKDDDEKKEEDEMDVPERPRSAVGHAGRYHKREREKMRNYSYEDLNAILGGGAFGGLEEVRANHNNDDDDRNDSDVSKDKKVDSDDSKKNDDDGGKKKKKKSSKKEKKDKGDCKNSDKEGSPSDEMVMTKFTFPPKPKDWWGHAFGFCQEGCGKDSDGYNATGNNNDATNKNKNKLGFTEDEQIELFERAHLTATTKSSHRGLGLSSAGKEVGHDFEGKKIALDGDVVPEDDADEKKAKSAPWSSLAKKLLKKSGKDGKLDADTFWQKLMKKALDGTAPENATVWDDAMRWTIRRDGKFIVGYDFVTLCK